MKIEIPQNAQRVLQKPAESKDPARRKEVQRKRESPSGFHYYNLYLTCPRKWYIKYILGLQPIYTSPPLIFGGAIHDAIESYYKNNLDPGVLEREFLASLDGRRDEYESGSQYLEDRDKGLFMLSTWVQSWMEVDRQEFEILEVEKQYTIPIGPPEASFDFTVRPDRVVRRLSDGAIIIPDVKTTGWSLEKMISSTKLQDQLTSYIWAWDKVHPETPATAAQVDAIFARTKTAKAERSEDIIITEFMKKQFELGLYGLINEITQKVLGLEQYPWPILFPRSGSACGMFGCVYSSICRENIQPGEIPDGFKHDPWVEVEDWLKRAQNFNIGALRWDEAPKEVKEKNANKSSEAVDKHSEEV